MRSAAAEMTAPRKGAAKSGVATATETATTASAVASRNRGRAKANQSQCYDAKYSFCFHVYTFAPATVRATARR
jgi:hypothetical protein